MLESRHDISHTNQNQFTLSPDQDLMSMPLKFRIVSRLKTGSQAVLFSDPDHPFYSFKDCVEEAIRRGIDLSYADLTDPFDGLEILRANKEKREINRFKFKRLSLAYGHYDGGVFKNSFIEGVDFSGSSLKRCDFSGDYTRQDLEDHHCIGYTTEGAGADFSGCDLSYTKFDNAILSESRFSTLIDYEKEKRALCLLDQTKFHHTDLRHARFSFARLDNPIFEPVSKNDIQGLQFECCDFSNTYAFPYMYKDAIRFTSCQNVK